MAFEPIKFVAPPRPAGLGEPMVALQPLPLGAKHRFHAMVKPVGSMCNLDCTYCYYLHKEELLGQPRQPRMSDEMLERHIRQTNRENAKFPLDVYRFLTRELGAKRIQLIACVEPKVFRDVAPQRWDSAQLPVVGTPQAKPGAPDSVVTDWSVDPEEPEEPPGSHARGRGGAELPVPGPQALLCAHPARHAADSASRPSRTEITHLTGR